VMSLVSTKLWNGSLLRRKRKSGRNCAAAF
jgi:hypothetical protein